MTTMSAGVSCTIVPKRRQRHYSYDESLDESAKLIADEPVEMEKEAPAEESESVETAELNDSEAPPAFEE